MRVEQNIDAINSALASGATVGILESEIPADSTRMAMLFAVLGLIMIIYPFFQKYFIKGLTLGSVKG